METQDSPLKDCQTVKRTWHTFQLTQFSRDDYFIVKVAYELGTGTDRI